jgi:DNA segregation ATPase FtsK/SpoIIIE-like protein
MGVEKLLGRGDMLFTSSVQFLIRGPHNLS